jgi:hypothetical protein
MTEIKEHDEIRLLREVEADVIGEHRIVRMPVGARGAVVMVHGQKDNPEGFEIEFVLVPLKEYAIASVYAKDVELTWSDPAND